MPANHDMTTLDVDDGSEPTAVVTRSRTIREGFVQVHRVLLQDGMTPVQALIYGELEYWCGRYTVPYPGQETIAKRLGLTRDRVADAMRWLEDNGWIRRTRDFARGHRYEILRSPEDTTTNAGNHHNRENPAIEAGKPRNRGGKTPQQRRENPARIRSKKEEGKEELKRDDEQPSPFVVELLEILGAEPTGAKQYQFISATDKQNRAAGLDSADVAREYAMWQEGETRKDYQHRNRVQGWANMCKRERGKPRRSNGSTPKPGTREYYEQPEVKAAMKKHEEEMHQWMKDRENERERCNQSELPLTTGSQSS